MTTEPTGIVEFVKYPTEGDQRMPDHKIVDLDEWTAARNELLVTMLGVIWDVLWSSRRN